MAKQAGNIYNAVFIKLMFYCVGTGNTQVSNLYIILKVIRALNKLGSEGRIRGREGEKKERKGERGEREGGK